MAEQPALNRIYVLGYSANDRDYPIVSLTADPRVAGYQVPKDLSACPDKRYPNHVFTGAQPISGDQRVRHVWEILPSPWVPFTRYDDGLGPVQGRRRSVKNEGQVASLTADKRTTYEAREGSAIVYTELEETWEIKVDEDGNSLFPIRDRDFYDPSRGPVQERRQLFVPTGEEEGSLENVNGVITQTSYEPYNEFLSVKIVQTYKVDGPQLIGKATDNDGQLVTVTTQRKGADGYIPPNPTATRTVEVSREDAEALIERIVDTPEIFKANTFSVERPDPIPQKFRVAVPIQSSQEIVEGTAVTPTLEEGEISKSEEQRNKFIKRVSSTSRDQAVLPKTLTGKATDNDRQEVTITETLQLGNTDEAPTATKTVESEALGDGNYVVRKTEVPAVFGAETFRKTREDLTPQKFKAAQEDSTVEQNVAGIASSAITLATGEFAKSEQQVNKFVKRVSTTSRSTTVTPAPLIESVLTNDGQVGTRTLTLAAGPQSITPSATMVDANVEALGDGRTVKTEVVVPNVFTGKTVQKSRIDLTPEKFKAKQEDTITEESVAGTLTPEAQIILGTGEFRKSEQQVTEFVKRVSTTKRDTSATQTLTESLVTPQGQVATRTLNLVTVDPNNPPVLTPDAKTVDASIEAIGDGRAIITNVTLVGDVFPNKTIQKTRADLTPQKFRAAQEDTTIEETVAGLINTNIVLGEGEFSKSEQQVTEFVKRTSTNSRILSESKELNEIIVLPDQRIATRKLTLATKDDLRDEDGNITLKGGATLVDGSIEELGDGRLIKTEVTAAVFDEASASAEKPVNIPARFLANKNITTSSSVTAGSDVSASISGNQIAQQVQRVSAHRIKTTTTAQSLSDFSTLEGYDYDENFDIKIPYKEYISSQIPLTTSSIACEVDPLGDGRFLVKEYKLDTIDSIIDDIKLSFPTRSTISGVPPVLKKCEVNWEQSTSDGTYTATGSGSTEGNTGSVSGSGRGRANGGASVIPVFIIETEEINTTNVPTTSYFFFVKYPVTVADIKSKIGETVLDWPIFKPKSHTITAKGQNVRVNTEVDYSLQYNFGTESTSRSQTSGSGNGSDIENRIVTVRIPPCLHAKIQQEAQPEEEATATSGVSVNFGEAEIKIEATPKKQKAKGFVAFDLGQTSPTNVPRAGIYLIDYRVEPYKFGYARVYAETVDALIFASS